MSCALCGGSLELVAVMPAVPTVCNALLPTREAAERVPRGDIDLALCTSCAAARNVAFDPLAAPYQDGYENSLDCSPTFHAYAEDLARRLVADHALGGGVVLEIGCGRGEFLELVCRFGGGGTNGVGVDPSLRAPVQQLGQSVQLRRGRFPGSEGDVRADAVVCRHVLEHVDDPTALAAAMARTRRARPSLVAYVEVPDAFHMLRTGGVWDLLYEHAWYFSAPALAGLVAGHGFDVWRVGTSFGGQYLWVEARAPAMERRRGRVPGAGPDVAEVVAAARSFGDAVDRCRHRWADVLTERRRSGHRVAVWGVGSKGTTFLNWVPGAEGVSAVVDVNPRKHGGFVPGTGHRVVGPEELVAQPPDTVLVMNAMYAQEIRGSLRRLGIDADVVVVEGAAVPAVQSGSTPT